MANIQIWNQIAQIITPPSSSNSSSPSFISYPHQLNNTPTHQKLFLQSSNTVNNDNSSFVNLPPQPSHHHHHYHHPYQTFSSNSNNRSSCTEEVTSRLNQKSNNCKIFYPLCHHDKKSNVGSRYSNNNRHSSFRKNKKFPKNFNNQYLVEQKRVHQLAGPQNVSSSNNDVTVSQGSGYQYHQNQQPQNFSMLGIRNNHHNSNNNGQNGMQINHEANFYQQQPYFQNPQQQQLQQFQQQIYMQQQQQSFQQKQSQQQQQNYKQQTYVQNYLSEQQKKMLPNQNIDQVWDNSLRNNCIIQNKRCYQNNQKTTTKPNHQVHYNNKRDEKRRKPQVMEQKQYQIELALPDTLKTGEFPKSFSDKRKKLENNSSNNCLLQLSSTTSTTTSTTKKTEDKDNNQKFQSQINNFIRKSKQNKPLSAFVRSYDVSRGNRYIPVLPRYLRKDWI